MKQLHLLVIVQSRCLSLFGHTTRMLDKADARRILMVSPVRLEDTSRMFSYNAVQDYSKT